MFSRTTKTLVYNKINYYYFYNSNENYSNHHHHRFLKARSRRLQLLVYSLNVARFCGRRDNTVRSSNLFDAPNRNDSIFENPVQGLMESVSDRFDFSIRD